MTASASAIPREAEIRAAIAAHPELTDRQIARLVHHRWWTDVRLVRERLGAAARPSLLPELPELPRRVRRRPSLSVEPEPEPLAGDRAAWPPISDRAAQALALIPRAPSPVVDWLRRRYLRERAADFGLLDAPR